MEANTALEQAGEEVNLSSIRQISLIASLLSFLPHCSSSRGCHLDVPRKRRLLESFLSTFHTFNTWSIHTLSKDLSNKYLLSVCYNLF